MAVVEQMVEQVANASTDLEVVTVDKEAKITVLVALERVSFKG
jgi:hypothetical protein